MLRQLHVISVKMETGIILVSDLTEGEYVDDKEEGSKQRALRHTLVDWGWAAAGVADSDRLFPVSEDMTDTRRELFR